MKTELGSPKAGMLCIHKSEELSAELDPYIGKYFYLLKKKQQLLIHISELMTSAANNLILKVLTKMQLLDVLLHNQKEMLELVYWVKNKFNSIKKLLFWLDHQSKK